MGKSRRKFDLEFKKRIVQEYLSGTRSAREIAEAEGLEIGQIYNWKTQLETRAKVDRIEEIQTTEGVSFEQARKCVERKVGQRSYRQIGWEWRPFAPDSDAGHSGAAGSFDTGRRILNHDRPRGS